MIYLVSKDKKLFETNNIMNISVEESLKLLEPLQIVGLDTETSGLSAWNDTLLLVQLGCRDFQVVIDCKTIDITLYKDYLESDRLFVGWNLKFDIQFLFEKNIILKNIYDGMIAEKLRWLGYPAGLHGLSLKDAGKNYLNIELDKSIRGKIIWAKVLSDDIIIYGAEDVAHLEDIMREQKKALKEQNLLTAIDIENKFVIPLAYTEWCGIKLDPQKWKNKMQLDKIREEKAKVELDKWLLENEPNSPYIFVDTQGDLFNPNGFDLTPKVKINWNSAKQLIPIFKKYGVDVTTEDREKGGQKDSVDAKVLKPQKNKCSLIPIYLEYKEATKITSTYGENFLDQIDNKRGRIKSKFNQLGTDTGRLSSGGKDGTTEYINFQNLPADKETRECFISEEGNKFISIDYSGEESFLMASIANDKAMLNELINGDKDLHTLTAKIVFPDKIPFDTPTEVVKTKFKELRKISKGYEFAFNYNGNADTIKRNFGLSDEEANRIYNAYMNGFNGLKKYQEFKHKDWWEKGYILINPLTGHKAYIYDYEQLRKDKQWMSTLDWNYYREMKRDCPDCDTVQRVKHFFKRKSASDKQASNYEIQGTGAIIFKIATINFFNWIVKNNLFGKVKLCIPVHDEWNIEAPNTIAEEVAKQLYIKMLDAGKIFCTRCNLDADISRLPNGELPTYWIH